MIIGLVACYNAVRVGLVTEPATVFGGVLLWIHGWIADLPPAYEYERARWILLTLLEFSYLAIHIWAYVCTDSWVFLVCILMQSFHTALYALIATASLGLDLISCALAKLST